jgi:hypothetical protein
MRAVGGVLAAAMALASRRAAAEAQPREINAPAAMVVFRSPTCPTEARAARFAQLLAIELASARIQLLHDAPVPGAIMAVETDGGLCDPASREVNIALVHSGSRAISTIDMADVEPGARIRALALATAELVRAALAQMPTNALAANGVKEPVPAREKNAQSSEVTVAPRAMNERGSDPERAPAKAERAASFAARGEGSRAYRADVRALGMWRFFAAESTQIVGFGIGAGLRLRPEWLSVRADAMAGFASANDALGDVRLATYSGALSVVATSGATPEFEIGPQFELGYARAAGSAGGASTTALVDGRAVALAAITAGARFWADRWVLSAHADVGATVAGAEVYADDRRIAAIRGFFAGIRAGLAFGF